MQLITKEIAKQLPAIRATEAQDFDEKIVFLKLFGIGTYGASDYYIVEADQETGQLWGFCCPAGWEMGEWGTVNLATLEALRWGTVPAIERDRGWKPRPFGEIRKTKDELAEQARKHRERQASATPYVHIKSPKELAIEEARKIRRPVEVPQQEPFKCDPDDQPGPIQVKRIEKAFSKLRITADQHKEADDGVDGKPYFALVYHINIGRAHPVREEYYTERAALQAKYPLISKKNAAAMLKDIEEAILRVEKMQPVVDRRQFSEPSATMR